MAPESGGSAAFAPLPEVASAPGDHWSVSSQARGLIRELRDRVDEVVMDAALRSQERRWAMMSFHSAVSTILHAELLSSSAMEARADAFALARTASEWPLPRTYSDFLQYVSRQAGVCLEIATICGEALVQRTQFLQTRLTAV